MKRILILCIMSLTLISMIGCGTDSQTTKEEKQEELYTVTVFSTLTGETIYVFRNVKLSFISGRGKHARLRIRYYSDNGEFTSTDVMLDSNISYIEEDKDDQAQDD